MNINIHAIILTVLGVGAALSQTPAKDALDAISKARANVQTSTQYKEYVLEEKSLATDAVKNINPATISPADAFDYAKLYVILDQHRIVCSLVQKYLTTTPAPNDKCDAQLLMLQSCNSLSDGAMLAQALATTAPTTAEQALTLAYDSSAEFAETIFKAKGMGQALQALDGVEKKMVYYDTAKAAPRFLNGRKTYLLSLHKNDPSFKLPTEGEMLEQVRWLLEMQNLVGKFNLVKARATIFQDAGQRNVGLGIIDKFIAEHPDFEPAKSIRKSFMLEGNPAPELAYDRKYGDFTSLAAWKGKVVIIDTFAHWCGPCKASFTDVRKMYDDLHSSGLELVGVTSYYGYYGQEEGLAPASEYAKMAAFVKAYRIDWPIIFAPAGNSLLGNTDFTQYGITGVPTAILIGRDGKVLDSETGYTSESFKGWRQKVEAALAGG